MSAGGSAVSAEPSGASEGAPHADSPHWHASDGDAALKVLLQAAFDDQIPDVNGKITQTALQQVITVVLDGLPLGSAGASGCAAAAATAAALGAAKMFQFDELWRLLSPVMSQA